MSKEYDIHPIGEFILGLGIVSIMGTILFCTLLIFAIIVSMA